MIRGEGACLVCGKPLKYYEKALPMECAMCHKTFESYASCEDGHYICDACHAKEGIQVILEECGRTVSRDPIEIMMGLMEHPFIYMHGPEHHIMVGAALIAAYHNSGGKVELPAALEEMKNRGSEVPGGACGFWGCCGAGVSTGIFMSIILKATPLSGKSWGLSNQMTAKALAEIAKYGGPRCCKRNSFTAAKAAVEFTNEVTGILMELPKKIRCGFSKENQQCLKRHCPYHLPV